jgi:hypothetical protein
MQVQSDVLLRGAGIEAAKSRQGRRKAMAKRTSKDQSSQGKARRKPSKTKDLPVDRKAKNVKGGAFSTPITGGGLRNTVGGIRYTI